jgi:hypothetical protein
MTRLILSKKMSLTHQQHTTVIGIRRSSMINLNTDEKYVYVENTQKKTMCCSFYFRKFYDANKRKKIFKKRFMCGIVDCIWKYMIQNTQHHIEIAEYFLFDWIQGGINVKNNLQINRNIYHQKNIR